VCVCFSFGDCKYSIEHKHLKYNFTAVISFYRYNKFYIKNTEQESHRSA